MKMLFTGVGRSVLWETVLSVWLPPQAVLKTSGTVSPNTDRTSQPVNNICIFKTWIPYSRDWNLNSRFNRCRDFGFLNLNSGFQSPGFPIPNPTIPNCTNKIILYSGIRLFLHGSIKHGLRTADHGLRTGYKTRTRYKMRTPNWV